MEINEKNKKKEQQALIIRKYQQYLKLEKSLSPNTLDAYLTDLDKLMSFLTLEGIDVLEVCLSDLQRFAAGLHDIGIHPRSQARILSGIKSFFRFLIMADYLEADPSELLEGPKIGLKLPEVLTVEEIDNIISSVDRSKAEGQRNRAILETLYSCGLRVSELVSLKLSDLYFDEGFIKVEGKGSKQRLVPISPRAINEIKLYFLDRNRIEVKKDYEDFVFVSQRKGKSLSRIMIFHMIKELAQMRVSPKTSVRTLSDTPLPLIYWKVAPIYGPSNACSDTNRLRRPKFIPISTETCFAARLSSIIPEISSIGEKKSRVFIKL